MRTILLSSLLIALAPLAAEAQAAPARGTGRVVLPAPPPTAPAPAVQAPPPPAAPAPALQAPPPPAAQPLPPAPVAAPPATALPAPPSSPVAPPSATPLPPPSAPAALPPPPPGYGYQQGYPSGEATDYGAPPSDGAYQEVSARRTALYGELREVDGRMRELKQERRHVRLGGPIAMMGAGYGVALVSGLVALSGFAVAEAIEDDDWWDDDDVDWNDNGRVTHADERAARNTARVFAGFAAVGLGVGVGGTVLLAKRLRERRANAPEFEDLRERRRELRHELRYGASVMPGMASLSLSGRF